MAMTLSHCMIKVDDPDAALAFYRDVLGLEVRQDVAMGPMRWITVGPPAQPDLEILLESPGMLQDATAAERVQLAGMLRRGLLSGLIFAVDDCDETFARVAASGAEVVQEPFNQPYGVRDCAFRDPAGNQIRFNAPLPQPR